MSLLLRRHLYPIATFAFVGLIVFGPVLFAGRGLFSHDSGAEYYPQFIYPIVPWTTQLFAGYPLEADPQNFSFYPVRHLFSAIGGWNAFAVFPYVAGAYFFCLYVRELTRRERPAIVGGLIFAFSPYLVRYLPMQPLPHTVLWVPLLFFSLERSRRDPGLWTVLCGGGACGFMLLAGHFQTALYVFVCASFYALFSVSCATDARRRLVLRYAGMALLGAVIAAPQLFRTYELVRSSERGAIDFSTFVSFSMRWIEWTRLVVPMAYTPFNQGVWSGETGCALSNIRGDQISFGFYAPLVAATSLLFHRRRIVCFWSAIILFSFLYGLGDETFLARLFFEIPGYKLFRVPTRHGSLLVFGGATLAACGTAAAFEQHRSYRRTLFWGAVGLVIVSLIGMAALHSRSCLPFGWAMGLTLAQLGLVVGLGAVGLSGKLGRRRHLPSGVAFFAVLLSVLFDVIPTALSTYGLEPKAGVVPTLPQTVPDPPFIGDRFLNKRAFLSPEHAVAVSGELALSSTRFWSVRGISSPRSALPPNASMNWGVPSVSGYSPLAPRQVLEVTEGSYLGHALGKWWTEDNVSLDLAAVRIVAIPNGDQPGRHIAGVPFHRFAFGAQLSKEHPSTEVHLHSPAALHRLALLADLASAVGVAHGVELGRIELEDADGTITPLRLKAGADLSDWAAGCPSVMHRLEHQPPPAVDQRPARLAGEDCLASRYLVVRELDIKEPIKRIRIRHTHDGSVVLRVHGVTVYETASRRPRLLSPTGSYLEGSNRWSLFLSTGATDFWTNRHALPRARFVSQIIHEGDHAQRLNMIHGPRAEGDSFNPRTQALVEDLPSQAFSESCLSLTPKIREHGEDVIEMITRNRVDCFLVLADTYYPGWVARIDGRPAPIVRTNHAFRGVIVPAGTSSVFFSYEPRLLWVLDVSSLIAICGSVLALIAFGYLGLREAKKRPQEARMA